MMSFFVNTRVGTSAPSVAGGDAAPTSTASTASTTAVDKNTISPLGSPKREVMVATKSGSSVVLKFEPQGLSPRKTKDSDGVAAPALAATPASSSGSSLSPSSASVSSSGSSTSTVAPSPKPTGGFSFGSTKEGTAEKGEEDVASDAKPPAPYPPMTTKASGGFGAATTTTTTSKASSSGGFPAVGGTAPSKAGAPAAVASSSSRSSSSQAKPTDEGLLGAGGKPFDCVKPATAKTGSKTTSGGGIRAGFGQQVKQHQRHQPTGAAPVSSLTTPLPSTTTTKATTDDAPCTSAPVASSGSTLDGRSDSSDGGGGGGANSSSEATAAVPLPSPPPSSTETKLSHPASVAPAAVVSGGGRRGGKEEGQDCEQDAMDRDNDGNDEAFDVPGVPETSTRRRSQSMGARERHGVVVFGACVPCVG